MPVAVASADATTVDESGRDVILRLTGNSLGLGGPSVKAFFSLVLTFGQILSETAWGVGRVSDHSMFRTGGDWAGLDECCPANIGVMFADKNGGRGSSCWPVGRGRR